MVMMMVMPRIMMMVMVVMILMARIMMMVMVVMMVMARIMMMAKVVSEEIVVAFAPMTIEKVEQALITLIVMS